MIDENNQNNQQSNTDQKIKEITEKIEFFLKNNKKALMIWVPIFLIFILVLIFWWEKQYDKDKLRNKMTEIQFETDKKESVDLLEWSVKIVKPWVTWLVKEYYEIVNWEEKIRIREKNCEWCRAVERQQEEIWRFPINEAIVEATKVAQNTLQYVKDKDFNSFKPILADDWVKNLESSKYKSLLEEKWFELESFTLWECTWNLKQTEYMEIICRTDVSYKYKNTQSMKYKLDLSIVYDKWQKKWWIVFPFSYKYSDWIDVTTKRKASWRVDASVNSSLSILEWTIISYFHKLHKQDFIHWRFRTNQIYDYIIVEDFIVYKKKEKDKDWQETEQEFTEKVWESKVNVRRWVVDDYSQFNAWFDYTKDDKWIYTIDTYFPVNKPKYIKWWDWNFKDWEMFVKQVVKITPWINTVNPYLKFPSIEFNLTEYKLLYQKPFLLWWKKKEE